MAKTEASAPFREWWQYPRQVYIRCSSELVPCPEAMGYTMGKTLGSGTYAKVKAAWSPFEGRMVNDIQNDKTSPTSISRGARARLQLNNLINYFILSFRLQ